MARNDAIDPEAEITRWIKRKFLAKDDDGNVELDASDCPAFVFPQAFQLRADLNEDYLSVTCLDFFDGDRASRLKAAADAVRRSQSSKKLSQDSAFAVAVTERVRSACESFGHRVRILEEPIDENCGHAAIRRFPPETSELHAVLSRDIFFERYLYRSLVD